MKKGRAPKETGKENSRHLGQKSVRFTGNYLSVFPHLWMTFQKELLLLFVLETRKIPFLRAILVALDLYVSFCMGRKYRSLASRGMWVSLTSWYRPAYKETQSVTDRDGCFHGNNI